MSAVDNRSASFQLKQVTDGAFVGWKKLLKWFFYTAALEI